MPVRAKVRCSFKDLTQTTVYFHPVFDGSEENKAFFESTPAGQVILNIGNTAAFGNFTQGKEYYLDFTPAPGA
ncbi:MAG: hypothetical protein ACRD4Q_00140 [Candidatus Acidiferrales bacterium]